MKNIDNYITERLHITKNTKVNNVHPENWVSIDDFDSSDFAEAVEEYGEFEYEDILIATHGEPLYINGRKVLSILDDDGLKYSFKDKSGRELESALYLNQLDSDIVEKLYNYLINR